MDFPAFCTNCGQPTSSASNFCTSCGAALKATTSAPAPVTLNLDVLTGLARQLRSLALRRRRLLLSLLAVALLSGSAYVWYEKRMSDEGIPISFTEANSWLYENATERRESPAAPVSLSVEDEHNGAIQAIPGEVVVVFDGTPEVQNVRKVFRELGGRIIARLPAVGAYLVRTGRGKELNFTKRIRGAGDIVMYAEPNAAFKLVGVTVVDQFSSAGDHGKQVRAVVEAHGGKTTKTINADVSGGPSAWLYLNAIGKAASDRTPGEPLLINLSAGGQTASEEIRMLRTVASAIHLIPEERRENLVISIAAGNSRLDLEPVLDAVRSDPRMGSVMRDHILIVTTDQTNARLGDFANRVRSTSGDPDVVTIDNLEAQNGTSFAAPAAIGRIDEIIRETGVTASQAIAGVKQIAEGTRGLKTATGQPIKEARVDEATKAIKWAKDANANSAFEINEGVDKAQALVKARGEPFVGDISFTSVGGHTVAVVSPQVAGVSIHRTVSGTDNYYAADVQVTNERGQVSFGIPRARSGVVDTITVTAVQSQRSRQTRFTW